MIVKRSLPYYHIRIEQMDFSGYTCLVGRNYRRERCGMPAIRFNTEQYMNMIGHNNCMENTYKWIMHI